MLSGIQCNASWHLFTPSRPLRSVIEQTISDVLAVAAGVTRFIRLLSHAVKTNMAPKTIRNLGDKSEGVKTTRIGRDKGETVGANKRLTSITGKAAGKNTLGLMKDAKMSDSTTTPSEIKLKGKSQSTITAFLAGGAQDSLPVHITPSSESNVLGKEPTPPCTCDKKSCIENKEFFIKTTQYVESLSEIEDSNREISKKVLGLTRSRQSQTQQVDQSEQLECQSKEGTEGFENAASMSGRTLKWDYSGIGLADIPTIGTQGPVNDQIEIDTGASAGNPGNEYAMGTEAGILQSIYSSIKELQTETRIESRRARIATKTAGEGP
ncbi:hypothetical protein NDU88_003862 [Pleurodeles waltl]|uniref:Uncharacterized protein n=1 Tax=Pleurodeles waltl TaxID=8319 RepID=A0AAV7NS64_PLEWA|nr:hypothetical protein NDU88_003862 [Pleurodeles waltl]